MQELLSKISIPVNEHIYLKDPESSELGKKIVAGGIDMLDEIGFESFTFKKLAKRIGSTEASIYRYFEGKHKFLIYLTAWYWGWMEYRLVFSLANVESPVKRLERAVELVTEFVEEDMSFNHINEVKLYRIVIEQSTKSYSTRDVDKENKHGIFSSYKGLVGRISDIIHEIDPKYPYPHMLISTVIEGSHHQRYFAEHLPRLTDVINGKDAITEFYKELVLKTVIKPTP